MNINKIKGKIDAIYFLYMVAVFPLFYRDKYYNITASKRGFFIWGTAIYVIVAGMLLLMMRGTLKEYWRSRKFILVTAVLLILSLCISLTGAWDIPEAFWGTYFKQTGLLLYLLGILAVLCLRFRVDSGVSCELSPDNAGGVKSVADRSAVARSAAFKSVEVVSAICIDVVYLLQTLNRFGIDPLGMRVDHLMDELKMFLSTLGHTNYNGVFNCIFLMLAFILIIQSSDLLTRILWFINVFLGFCGLICTNADGAYLGLFMAFVFAEGCSWWLKRGEVYVSILAVLFLVSVWIIGIMQRICGLEEYFWGVSQMITGIKWTIFISMVVFIGLILRRFIRKYFLKKENAFKIYTWISFAGCILLVLFLVFSIIVVGPSWGSNRGEIYMNVLSAFRKADLRHKLFGYGFNNVMLTLDYFDLSIVGQQTVEDAHNLFLNSLITSGIVGTALWGILIGSIVYEDIKYLRMADNSESVNILEGQWRVLSLAGIFIFLVCGFLNGPQAITTPFMFVLLGI